MYYTNRSAVWEKKGECGKALADDDSAIRINPCYASAYTSRGVVWDDMKKYDMAIAEFNQAGAQPQ